MSPVTIELAHADRWLAASGGALDGVVAKAIGQPYLPGMRAMRKVKQQRTAECVVGGYRKSDTGVASLLLGLYGADGSLDLVGFVSAFLVAKRAALAKTLQLYEGGAGFAGRAPSS